LSGHRVEVVVVQPSGRSVTMTVPGEVEGNRDAFLAAPLGGYIERVSVKEGDRVKAGDVLAHVDRTTHAVRQTRAKLDLDSARRELTRAQTIADSIPQAELDAARDRVNIAEATLQELRHNSNRALIVAPFSGVVTKVDAEVGEVAPPGAPLIRLVQLSPVRVSVALSDRDLGLAKVGARATIYLDARAGRFEGTIASISRAADLKTRSFEALIEVPNEKELLLPGMIANVTLDSGATETETPPNKSLAKAGATKAQNKQPPSNPDQLIVSQDWLVTRRDGVGVFIEQHGKAVWRPVQLGDVLRKQVVVESGLKAGDALIIVGHRELVDGDEVLVHRRGRCCLNGRAIFDN
jgi:membrane fusion protein, multidrug efflux system